MTHFGGLLSAIQIAMTTGKAKAAPSSRRMFRLLLMGALFSFATTVSTAQDPTPRKFVIGTKQAAPFSYRVGEGPWQGISIELWRQIAEDLGVAYEFREVPLAGLVSGLQEGVLDVSVAALTVTAERDEKVDFTYSFYPSGLAIAVPTVESGGVGKTVGAIFSWKFLQVVGVLVLLLFAVGLLVWLFERRQNPEQFGDGKSKGLASGFWWSAVTMTTVGYGDKAPISVGGRIVALIWMFAAIIAISGFTANIASSLTVARLETSIRGPEDLRDLTTVLTVKDSTAERYLDRARIRCQSRATIADALDQLARGAAAAVVYDAPILKYLVHNKHGSRVTVLPLVFERQDYAFGLPLNSPHRKSINQALLRQIREPEWGQTLARYLGE